MINKLHATGSGTNLHFVYIHLVGERQTAVYF